uniref:Uncharacterized protein n=2 Tax=Arundo donax TaxID=35708 RepID=A0A0A9D4L2_ARUDO
MLGREININPFRKHQLSFLHSNRPKQHAKLRRLQNFHILMKLDSHENLATDTKSAYNSVVSASIHHFEIQNLSHYMLNPRAA